MLAGVPGQDDPATVVLGIVKKLLHLLRANLAGLVHDDDRTRRQLPLREEFPDGLSACHSITLQINDLLTLRRDDLQRAPGRQQSVPHFPKCIAFAGASATAKQGHKVAGTQDVFDRLALVPVETRLPDRVIYAERAKLSDSFLRRGNDVPFAVQRRPCRNSVTTVCVTDVDRKSTRL